LARSLEVDLDFCKENPDDHSQHDQHEILKGEKWNRDCWKGIIIVLKNEKRFGRDIEEIQKENLDFLEDCAFGGMSGFLIEGLESWRMGRIDLQFLH